jgi:hypothetical protein
MKLFKYIFILSVLTLASCFEEPGTEIVWGNEAFLELDRAGQPNTVLPPATFARLNDGTTYPFNIQVNLMGKPRGEDTDVTFEFGATSTAIDGVHYTKVSPAGTTVTIPAGENVANIELDIIADAINPGQILTLITTITGGDLPLSKYVSATFRFQITCASTLAGVYDGETDWIDYYGVPGSDTYVETLALVAGTQNRYNLADLSGGMEPIVWSNPPVATVFQDICGTISLVSAPYFYAYFIDSNNSDVNAGTGVITITWSNAFAENGVTVLTPQ